jgi:8-oxo-dGTP pyrophosphatase MutT (NUDIX family)
VRDGRVLMCHRSAEREWYPDVWDLPGGHIEPGESAADAVARELREELTITVAPPDDPPFAVISGLDFDLPVWVLTAWLGDISNAAPAEHDDLAWFAASELAGLRFLSDSYPGLVARALA